MKTKLIVTLFFVVVFVSRCVPCLREKRVKEAAVNIVALCGGYAILMIIEFGNTLPSPLKPVELFLKNTLGLR